MIEIYTDGGVIKNGTTTLGVTWAACRVERSCIVKSISGVILGGFGNNYAELEALLQGITRLIEPGEEVRVSSDSKNALGAVFQGWNCRYASQKQLEMLDQVRHYESLTWRLLDGHPTKAQLAAGIGKRGNPVSEFNVHCDEVCTRLARRYKNDRAN